MGGAPMPPLPPPPPQLSSSQYRPPSQSYGGESYGGESRPPWQLTAQQKEEQQQQQETGPGFWSRLSSKIVTTTQSLLDKKSDDEQQQQQQQQQLYGGEGYQGRLFPSAAAFPPPSSSSFPPHGVGQQFPYQQERQQRQQPPGPPPTFRAAPPHLLPFSPAATFPPPPEEDEGLEESWGEEESRESLPDIFTVGPDNIVIVRNPRAMRQKMEAFARAGPRNIEVMANFEGGLKTFRTPDGRCKTETTESLVHNALLPPAACANLQTIAEKFDDEYKAATSPEARYANRENRKREMQRVVVTEGNMYSINFGALPLSNVPLRANIESCLKSLAFHGVPTTIFSPGYGEALSQILAISLPGLTGPEGLLPPNIRLVSNFFRSGPDGLVTGFTSPLVHEENLNSTTARHFRSGMMMGMPPRPPPNVLLLGASVKDLKMSKGGGMERQVLSLGFLESDSDFVKELPKFLEGYDAVVLGDGGLQYFNHLVEQIVGTS